MQVLFHVQGFALISSILVKYVTIWMKLRDTFFVHCICVHVFYALPLFWWWTVLDVCVYMSYKTRYIYMCVCMYVCMSMYVCIHVCMYVCISDISIWYLQRLLKEAEKTPNVVKATNRPGLYEELEDLQKRWNIAVACTILCV